ncbi:MAG TPA: hypothetical protein VL500_07480 [Candidatus Eisenbacteria bacterium]|nr:hypothetical protein [Candidatus Eisenbacteria bacterium]
MPKTKALSSFIKRIKRINARFRSLKDQDGPLADRLRNAKDSLIDEMASACPHRTMIAIRGFKRRNAPSVPALRLCERCGFCESAPRPSGLPKRPGTLTQFLPVEDYALRQGLALKRLGINI